MIESEAMPQSDVTASIIIPAWRLRNELQTCLDALAGSADAPPFEVIVVVNGANSEIVNLAESHPVVTKVIPLVENVGFGWACNVGAQAATGSYLIFLNDDAAVTPDWLHNLVTAAQAHSAAVMGSVLVSETGEVLELGNRILENGEVEFLGAGEPLTEASDSELLANRTVDYASGAALLVDSQVFNQVGGFDPLFMPAYYEDTDLQFRIKATGRQIWVTPKAVAVHGNNKSTKGLETFRQFAVDNSRGYFMARWGNVLHRAAERGEPVSAQISIPNAPRILGGLATATSDPVVVAAKAGEISQNYQAWLEKQVNTDAAQIAELTARCEWLDNRAAELSTQITELDARLQEVDSQLQDANNSLQHADDRLQQVESQLRQATTELAEQQAALQHWRTYGLEAWGKLSEAEADLAQLVELQTQNAQLGERCVWLDGRAAEFAEQIADLDARLIAEAADRGAIALDRDQLARQVQAIYSSRSWRAAAPLRLATAPIRGIRNRSN